MHTHNKGNFFILIIILIILRAYVSMAGDRDAETNAKMARVCPELASRYAKYPLQRKVRSASLYVVGITVPNFGCDDNSVYIINLMADPPDVSYRSVVD